MALPETSQIHPVFHVSQLRKALKPGVSISPVLPHDFNQFVVPVEVLDNRQKVKANRVVDQVLVRWSSDGLDPTWEDRDELQSRFPYAAAWSQAATQGGEGVSTPGSSGPGSQLDAGPDNSRAQGPTRRNRRPNQRVMGGQWVNAARAYNEAASETDGGSKIDQAGTAWRRLPT